MKSLAEFKRRIQLGVKVRTKYANGMELPVREVSIKQSNSFAFRTQIEDKSFQDSWIEYPKASNIEFPDNNTATIFWDTKDRKECLTYIFI